MCNICTQEKEQDRVLADDAKAFQKFRNGILAAAEKKHEARMKDTGDFDGEDESDEARENESWADEMDERVETKPE